MFQMSKYFIVYSGTSIKIVFTNHARVLCLKFCDIVFVMGTLRHKVNWLQCPSGDKCSVELKISLPGSSVPCLALMIKMW